MTTFYVGQRVRIVRPDSGSIRRGLTAGDEGVITAEDLIVDFRVQVSGKRNPFLDNGEENFPLYADELEPIISGHQPAELSVEELLPFLKEKVRS